MKNRIFHSFLYVYQRVKHWIPKAPTPPLIPRHLTLSATMTAPGCKTLPFSRHCRSSWYSLEHWRSGWWAPPKRGSLRHFIDLYKLVCYPTGWWCQPSEKYESQLGSLFPIYGKKKMFQTTNQPIILICSSTFMGIWWYFWYVLVI